MPVHRPAGAIAVGVTQPIRLGEQSPIKRFDQHRSQRQAMDGQRLPGGRDLLWLRIDPHNRCSTLVDLTDHSAVLRALRAERVRAAEEMFIALRNKQRNTLLELLEPVAASGVRSRAGSACGAERAPGAGIGSMMIMRFR